MVRKPPPLAATTAQSGRTCMHTERAHSHRARTAIRCDLSPTLALLARSLVAVVSFLVIKRTNVVMLKLLAISRNALVVFAGIMAFSDQVHPTILLLTSYFLDPTSYFLVAFLRSGLGHTVCWLRRLAHLLRRVQLYIDHAAAKLSCPGRARGSRTANTNDDHLYGSPSMYVGMCVF